MENEYDPIKTISGYLNVFGTEKTLDDLILIISKYRYSAWLDVLVKIEAIPFLINDQSEPFFKYIFGNEISNFLKSKDIDPCFDIINLPQLNLLRKIAIVYGKEDSDVDEGIQSSDILYALLIAIDVNSKCDDLSLHSEDLDTYWSFITRNGYAFSSEDGITLLTRARCMYLNEGVNVSFQDFGNFNEFLLSKVSLSVEQLLVLGYSLSLHHFEANWFYKTSIINKSEYYKNIIIDSSLTAAVFGGVSLSLEKVRKLIRKEMQGVPQSIGHSFDTFTKYPLIDLGSNRVVTSSLVKLYEKFTQNLLWFPLRLMNLNEDDRESFVQYIGGHRGILFERYIRSLLTEHVSDNQQIELVYIDAKHAKDGEELCDSILIQGDSIAIVEMKAKQPVELFRTTGSWSAVSDFLVEIKGAAEQIQTASEKILSGMYKDNIPPEGVRTIYPVIVLFDPLPTHGKIMRFIRDELKKENILTADIFAPLEILIVSDIERVSSILNNITIIDLLKIKIDQGLHSSETSFNNFLTLYARDGGLLCNHKPKEREEKTFQFLKENLNFK